MKILATGAAGMLGTSLVPLLIGGGHDVAPTDIDLSNVRPWGHGLPTIGHLDVRDREEIRDAFDELRPDLLLHMAAETSLEVCDADPDHAFLTNTVAVKYLALECRQRGVPMVFISTAGVFDGTKAGPYTEYDQPNPLNTYGASKYEAEKLVTSMLDDWYIIRAGWMVGGGDGKDHKFVARILQQVRDGQTTIYAVGDKYGTPTYTYDFGRCLLNLIRSGLYGLYHMACEGQGNRYDIAAHILNLLGREDIDLVEVDSTFFKVEFPSVRPRSEIMRNMALDLQDMNLMRPWREALDEYLVNHFRGLIRDASRVRTGVAP